MFTSATIHFIHSKTLVHSKELFVILSVSSSVMTLLSTVVDVRDDVYFCFAGKWRNHGVAHANGSLSLSATEDSSRLEPVSPVVLSAAFCTKLGFSSGARRNRFHH
jgi:hypothetical protein